MAINYGSDPRNDNESNESAFLTVTDGQTLDVVILAEGKDDIATCNQAGIFKYNGQSLVWVYNGATDPANELGIKPFYRAFLPVFVDGEVKFFGMSKQVYSNLLDTADAMEVNLKNQGLRIKRNGSGLQTNYTLALRGKKSVPAIDIPDISDFLNVFDVEETKEKILEIFKFSDWEDAVAALGKKKTTKTVSKTKTTDDLYKKLVEEESSDPAF